jgi:hypothetical protein
MKTTSEVMTDWYDKSSEILICVVLFPFLVLLSIPTVPFWLAAKIYTKWFQKEKE